MNRGEWHATARFLREQHPDWSHARIAESCGVTQSAVWKLFNAHRAREWVRRDNRRPERQAQKNAWDRAHQHKPCPNCGQPRNRQSTQCQGCWTATADVRRTVAEGMWADGWSHREIAETMGVSLHYLGIRRIRDGWDLPYRYKNTKLQRAAA